MLKIFIELFIDRLSKMGFSDVGLYLRADLEKVAAECLLEIASDRSSSLVEMPDGQWAVVQAGGYEVSIHADKDAAIEFWRSSVADHSLKWGSVPIVKINSV